MPSQKAKGAGLDLSPEKKKKQHVREIRGLFSDKESVVFAILEAMTAD